MEAPPTKKPRTEAQKAAFERARKAREANIIKKHMQLTEGTVDPFKGTLKEQSDTARDEAQPSGTVPSEQVIEQPHPAAPPVLEESQPMEVTQEEDEHDYIDFDPEELKTQLHSTKKEVQELAAAMKLALADLQGKHESLETSWQQHGVKTANMLNFV